MDQYYKKRLIPLTLPAFILFIAIVFVPFVIGVLYSFTGWRGTYFVGGGAWYDAFVGFDNYAKVFKSQKFIDALVYTIVFIGHYQYCIPGDGTSGECCTQGERCLSDDLFRSEPVGRSGPWLYMAVCF